MSHPTVLVNYRIPVKLKNEFESVCHRLHMPMTSQINILMREFVEKQKNVGEEAHDIEEPVEFFSDWENEQ